MNAITITSPSGKPLNAILDALVKRGIADWDSIVSIDVEEGRAGLTGDGEAPVDRIVLVVNQATYKASNNAELKAILEELVAAHGDAILDYAEALVYSPEADE